MEKLVNCDECFLIVKLSSTHVQHRITIKGVRFETFVCRNCFRRLDRCHVDAETSMNIDSVKGLVASFQSAVM